MMGAGCDFRLHGELMLFCDDVRKCGHDLPVVHGCELFAFESLNQAAMRNLSWAAMIRIDKQLHASAARIRRNPAARRQTRSPGSLPAEG
jgi:hypothetical protein